MTNFCSDDSLRQIITLDVAEVDFNQQIKIPIRKGLDPIIRQFTTSGVELMKNSQMDQATTILKVAYLVLLSMLSNGIFDKNKLKLNFSYYLETQNIDIDEKVPGKQFSISSYFNWVKSQEGPLLLQLINFAIQKSFSKEIYYTFLKTTNQQ